MSSEDLQSQDRPLRVQGYLVEAATSMKDDSVDLSRIVTGLRRQKTLMLVIVFALTGLAVVYAMIAKPIYRAEIMVASVASDDNRINVPGLGQLGELASIAGLSNSGTNQLEQAIAVLNSRQFTEMFIENNNLLPVLFARKWDSAGADWVLGEGEEPPLLSEAVKLFDERIRRVVRNKESGLIVLQIDWKEPELAAAWANQLITSLNQYLRDKDIEEIESRIKYLNSELQGTNVIELRQGIFRLIEQQIEAAMLANVRQEYAFKILDPAVAPASDDPIRPKKFMIIFVALLAASFLAIMVGMLRVAVSAREPL